jgi:hypothetical protein
VLPLQDAGISAAFFRPSEAQVNVLAQFSADLIGGVSDGMRTKINRDIRLNALGGNSSLDAMRDITRTLGIPPKASDPTTGVAYEAERILRTETNRSYSVATNAQQERLAEDVPDLQKQWLATGDARTRLSHLNAHGDIVDVGKPFIVGGAKLMYPLDPAGPPQETINCRCRSITVIPEIGPLETPLDAEIEAEKARRARDEKAKADKRARKAEPEPVTGKGYSTKLIPVQTIFELDDPLDEGYLVGAPGNFENLPADEVIIDFDRGDSGTRGPASVGKKFYGDWHSELSPQQRRELQRYSGGEYKNMNGLLRHGIEASEGRNPELDASNRDSIKKVQAIIDDAPPLPTNLRVYRRFGGFDLDKLNPGDIVEDRGFMSTTLSKQATDLNFGGDIAEIAVPKNTRAAFLGWTDVADHPEEIEMLFAPGSKMRILDKITDDRGEVRIIMEMIGG